MRRKTWAIGSGSAAALSRSAAQILCLLLPALPASAQISVGRNVQISHARGNAAHYESIVAADPLNPQRLLAASMIFYEGMKLQTDHSSIVYASFDGGKSWRVSLEPKSHAAAGVDPALTYAPDGSAHFATVGQYTLYRSPDGGRTWDKPVKVPDVLTGGMDREFLVADFNPRSPYRGNIYMSARVFPRLLTSSAGGDAIGVYISRDQGRSYGEPVFRLVQRPQSTGPTGNNVVLSDGTVVSLFGILNDVATSKPSASGRMPQANATLHVVHSEDGGATLGEAIAVSPFWSNPTRSVAMLCPWLAVDPGSVAFKDRLYAVWNDFRSGRLEVLLSSSSDLGRSWSYPQVINDDPRPLNPENGPDAILPTVAVNKDGVVVAAWYDRRESPDNLGWHVRVRASLDGGETWLPSQKVSERPHTFSGHEHWAMWGEAGGEGTLSLQVNDFNFYLSPGHTSGLVAAADGVFHAVWVDNRTGMAQLWTAPISVAAKAAENGGGELAELNDLGGLLSWEIVKRTQQRAKGRDRLILTVRLKNTSSELLQPRRLKLRLLQAQSDVAIPRMLNADNGQSGPGAVWDFSDTIPQEGLAPGAFGKEKDLVFALTDIRPFRRDPDNIHTVLNISAKVLGEVPAQLEMPTR